jgi:release factor glutamine methyltransferase
MEKIEFFYRKFYYDRHTLTPRLETESLVRLALEITQKNNIDALFDVWTGSAIIWISIEKNSNIKDIFGLEKSSLAMMVAKENIILNDSKLLLLKSDLLEVFLKNPYNHDFRWKKILFAANLPYIKDEDWINMSEDTSLEPKMALFWWKKTGFELYEKYFRQIKKFKEIFNPNKIFSLSEIWFDQREIAAQFFIKSNMEAKFYPDLRGIERFIYIEI